MKNHGFSLIELSLVLAIIGLLAGMTLAGRVVIRNSELNSISVDVSRFTGAIKTFQDKYKALPGDMSGATAMWGISAAGAACFTTPGAGTSTCNGNGDGQIGPIVGGCATCAETLNAWQHLKNANLIDGGYTGVAGNGSSYQHLPGINAPSSSMSGGGFGLTYKGTVAAADANYFPNNLGHIIMFGAQTTGITQGAILTPTEAQEIDTKIDDGRAAYGNVQAFKSSSTVTPGCTTTAVAATSLYNLGDGNQLCNLTFVTGF